MALGPDGNKLLLDYHGVPVISRLARELVSADVRRVVLVHGGAMRFGDDIATAFAAGCNARIDLAVLADERPHGTLNTLKCARPHLLGVPSFLSVEADALIDRADIEELAFKAPPAIVVTADVRAAPTHSRAALAGGLVSRMERPPGAAASADLGYAFAGWAHLDLTSLASCRSRMVAKVVRTSLASGAPVAAVVARSFRHFAVRSDYGRPLPTTPAAEDNKHAQA